MPTVVYLPAALEDLNEIWSYLAEQSQSFDVADRFVDSLDDTASLYAINPQLGSTRFELAPDLRCFAVGRYIAFYLPSHDGIEVIQIIHGSRDTPSVFRRQ